MANRSDRERKGRHMTGNRVEEKEGYGGKLEVRETGEAVGQERQERRKVGIRGETRGKTRGITLV